ncbi:hypothetical protein Tco_0363420 [Tanacetum coccineum]
MLHLPPGYVVDSDPEEDPKEDPKEDPAEYLVDGGEEKEQEESSEDDADDADAEEDSEDEEGEEHLASADSTTLLVVDPLPSADDTEVFETDESASTPLVPSPRLCRARVSVRPQTPMSATIEVLIAAVATALPSSSPLASPLSPWFEVEESSSAAAMQTRYTLAHRVDYGFIETMDASIQAAESRATTAIGEVNERVTNLATTQRQETYELQVRCEDAQNDRDLLRAQDHSESRSQAIEAQIRALQRDANVIQRFRELVRTAEAGPQDGPVDAGSSC